MKEKEESLITLTHREGWIIDVEAGDREKENYGVAVDIGTTTAVVMLWNCSDGSMAGVSAVTNPQGAYGADVIFPHHLCRRSGGKPADPAESGHRLHQPGHRRL